MKSYRVLPWIAGIGLIILGIGQVFGQFCNSGAGLAIIFGGLLIIVIAQANK